MLMLSKALSSMLCIPYLQEILSDYGKLSVDLVVRFLLFCKNHFVAKMVEE